jgi:outer membrane protein, multidrug efflux system
MRSTFTLTLAAVFSGCAALPGPTGGDRPAAALPSQWHAPLPHDGRLSEMGAWWQQFDDPLLVQLIAAAQDASPTIASARSRIEQARAARVGAGAALGPSLQAQTTLSRGREDFGLPIATSGAAGLQASWEIDVFGGGRAAADAAQARLDAARAQWHDARVSVAAEVATSYVGLRACEALLAQTQADAASRAETARLTELSTKSGFQSPANAALSRATAAQGQGNATQQRAQCELTVKSLVALTATAEPALRTQLAERTARMPQPAQIAVSAVPAQALAQRPDLFSAARDVEAASADTAEAQAQRWPRITLNGSISAAKAKSSLGTTDGTLWSFGPLAVSLPIFDGGARRANVDAARARYDEAASVYRARLRVAVQEVEQALVTLQSTAERTNDAQIAAEGFHASFVATETRQRGGLASLFELEDARRSDLQAQNALIDLQRERVAAWISLYRALGGGWRGDEPRLSQAAH